MTTPIYKSLKVTYATWQALTRLSAETGEPRTQLVERLVKEELERRKPAQGQRSIFEE